MDIFNKYPRIYRVNLKKSVIITLPVLLTGGTEFQTKTLVKVLADAGYRVIVCCFYEFEQDMVTNMQEAGAIVKLFRLNRCDGIFSLLKILYAYFREVKPDICHVQYIAPGFISVLAARLAVVPVVFATVHQPGHPYGKKAHLLLRAAARICTKFICISKSVEQSWFGRKSLFEAIVPLKNHCTIYNAVDFDAIVEAARENSELAILKKDKFGTDTVIGCVARLRQEKGQLILIRAFAQVVKFYTNVKLLMIGDGSDMAELKMLSETLGLAQNIIWMGRQAQADVYSMYGLMDMLVVPSLFEGFGLTAAEAMSAGLPVIASNIDGLAEVVHDGKSGILFPVGNSQVLAEKMIELLNDPAKAKLYGKNGQDRVKKLFMLDQFKKSMLGLYRK